jgi:hypothetical protein
MSKRIWWILGSVAVLSAGVYFGVTKLAPAKPVSPHEERIRGYFVALEEPMSDFKMLPKKEGQHWGISNDTTIILHEPSLQVTHIRRWPAWLKRNPEGVPGPGEVKNAEVAKSKLTELLPKLGLGDLEYKVLTAHRLETQPFLVTKNGRQEWEQRKARPRYFVAFRETNEDPRYYIDGLREVRAEFCANTGALLLFSVNYPAKAGVWESIITEDQATRKVREEWKSSSKSALVTRTTIDPIWIHYWTDYKKRQETPMSGGYMVRGLDAKGNIKCLGFVVGKTGKVSRTVCGDLPDSMNWNGATRNYQPTEVAP